MYASVHSSASGCCVTKGSPFPRDPSCCNASFMNAMVYCRQLLWISRCIMCHKMKCSAAIDLLCYMWSIELKLHNVARGKWWTQEKLGYILPFRNGLFSPVAFVLFKEINLTATLNVTCWFLVCVCIMFLVMLVMHMFRSQFPSLQ